MTKIANLIDHYQIHKMEAASQNKEISITNFLFIHFIDFDEHQHSDDHQHEDLPFKNITTTNLLFFESHYVSDSSKPILNINLEVGYFPQFLQSDFIHSIFRPPPYLII